ncbi:hypothetical protein [Desulfobulbus alkaliphilus]|uniref:hypothetical protein n=1 Tax=Desulfobulbus alkaliphilus TaxID=869814 RepID=UPI001962E693|nr:hypothetical protein [Desulfobulbus alkaliphilus]MBM9536320.1 hypothetical protein [Desulfobulbus alkaliphilus]
MAARALLRKTLPRTLIAPARVLERPVFIGKKTMLLSNLPRFRWLWAITLLIPLLFGTVFLVLPLFLNSNWLQHQISQHTGLTITWQEADLSAQGRLSLRQLTVDQNSKQGDFSLILADAAVTLELTSLFRHRQMRFRDLDARGVETLRIGEFRFVGEGGLTIESLRWHDHIDLTGIRLHLSDASVFRQDTLLSRDLTCITRLDLHGLVFPQPLIGNLIRRLSGALSFDAHADAWDLLNDYLRGVPWLRIGGHGRLSAQLNLDEGDLQQGSSVRLDSPQLRVWLHEADLPRDSNSDMQREKTGQSVQAAGIFQLEGAGRVELAVSSLAESCIGTTLQITLRDAWMRETTEDQLFLFSPLFSLNSVFPGADLIHPVQPLATTIEWQAAVMPDIAVLSRYLPPSSPLQLEHGLAELNARIDLEQDNLQATFRLDGKTTQITLLDQSLQGELRLHLPMKIDFARQRLDLSGGTLHLSALTNEDPGLRQAPHQPTVSLILEKAWLQLTRPYGDLFPAASTSDAMTMAPPAHPQQRFPDPLPVDGRIVLSASLHRLDVLDTFLHQLPDQRGMQISGQGRIQADLILTQGEVAAGSQADIIADDLGIRFMDLHVKGKGAVVAQHLLLDDQSLLHLRADFSEANLNQGPDARLLLESAALSLALQAPLKGMRMEAEYARMSLEWTRARIPDLSVLQYYLADDFPLQLLSGSATSEARFEFDRRNATGWLSTRGEAITTRFFDQVSLGELVLDINLRNLAFDGEKLDLSGSRLTLDAVAEQGGEALHTALAFDKVQVRNWLQINKQPNPDLEADLIVRGEIGQLGFLDSFMPREQDIRIRGSGTLHADLKLRRQQLAPTSRIAVHAEHLSVDFLKYRAAGAGILDLLSQGSTEAPGVLLSVQLPFFDMGRQADEIDYVTGQGFFLESSLPELNTPPEEALFQTRTKISLHHAEVTDLRVYNAYLPVDAGIELTGGQAWVQADFTLESDQASGQILLESMDSVVRIDEQLLTGRLSVKAVLNRGDVRTMRFDASGTQIRLDQVTLQDAHELYSEDWWAELYLFNNSLHWAQPLTLKSDLSLYMRDTGLLAQLFIQQARGDHWLGRMLNVAKVAGGAHIAMTAKSLHFQAVLHAGSIELDADLLLAGEQLNGELFVRRRPFSVAVTLKDNIPSVRLFGSGQ